MQFNRLAILAFVAFTVVYIIGLFLNVMEVDAAQYASISREMADDGSWLQVMHRHENYLDKPPLLFWLSAAMFKVFGVSNFTYKLPSFLFTLVGVYATFRLGKKLYNQYSGLVAALMLYGCQAWYLFNNDVRTDTLLAACVITAVWQLYEYMEERKFSNFILGFVFVALGMLAKGPLGIMIPAMALGPYLLYKRDFKMLFNPLWVIGIAIVGLLLTPMVWGLYKQYGNEGPLFFFWTQSFGRITGENVWKNDAGALFFVHTFLWAFLPFSLMAYLGWGKKTIQIIKSKAALLYAPDVLVLSGFTLPFIALSLSHYKLPHYIYVVAPFAALLAASYVVNLTLKWQNVFAYIHLLIVAAALGLVGLFCLWYFPLQSIVLWAVISVAVIAILWLIVKGKGLVKTLFPPLFAVALFNLVMNAHIYPNLLQYHSTSVMAEYVNEQHIPKDKLFYYQRIGHAFEFYTRMIVRQATIESIKESTTDMWIVTDAEGLNELTGNGISLQEKIPFNHYHIVMLTGKFLNPATRNEALEKRYLLHFTLPTH